MAAENTEYGNDICLRISPHSGKIIVEERKRDGVISFKEISPVDMYFMLNESYRNSERISYTWIHLKNGIITKRSPGPGGNGLVNQFLKTAGGMRKTERSLILRWTRPAHGGQALQRSDPFFPDDPRCRF